MWVGYYLLHLVLVHQGYLSDHDHLHQNHQYYLCFHMLAHLYHHLLRLRHLERMVDQNNY